MSAARDGVENLSMMIVMGVTGAGKSYFINQLAGKKVVEEGAQLDSCKFKDTHTKAAILIQNRHSGLSTCSRANRPQQGSTCRHTWV